MGITSPMLLQGSVMHGRLFPRKNHFQYRIYYLGLPLSKRIRMPIPYNAKGLMSFYDSDHGDGTYENLEDWAQKILKDHGIMIDGEIVLVAMPRIFGYVFNPVSFWLCHSKEGELKAVLCEVHNTFGEKHIYLCAHENGSAIMPDETLKAQKVFHVSPFLEREGYYTFRFKNDNQSFGAWIDYYDATGQKQLVTTLAGKWSDMTKESCRRVFWSYPLITFKAVALIHYQAIKLLLKKIHYRSKPKQLKERVSTTTNLTKI